MSSPSRRRPGRDPDLAAADAEVAELLAEDADEVPRVTSRHWRTEVLDGTVKQAIAAAPRDTAVVWRLPVDSLLAAEMTKLANEDGFARQAWIRMVLARYVSERTGIPTVTLLGSKARMLAPDRRGRRTRWTK